MTVIETLTAEERRLAETATERPDWNWGPRTQTVLGKLLRIHDQQRARILDLESELDIVEQSALERGERD